MSFRMFLIFFWASVVVFVGAPMVGLFMSKRSLGRIPISEEDFRDLESKAKTDWSLLTRRGRRRWRYLSVIWFVVFIIVVFCVRR